MSLEEPSFQLRELLDDVALQLESSFRQSLLTHRGELGVARENVLRDFLSRHLPKRFEVSSGFVFDASGAVSGQIDIVIADTYECPRFEVAGGKRFYPCEAVVGVGEVKTSLTSSRDFRSALDVLGAVKRLDRSGNGRNLRATDENPIDYKNHYLDQIFSFLFVIDRCLKPKTATNLIHDYISTKDPHEWPNMAFHFDKFLTTYQCRDGICPNAMHALRVACLTKNQQHDLFLKFYYYLARAIQVTSVARFTYWEHLGGGELTEMHTLPLTELDYAIP